MILIGQYDSPFVRRVGIALTLYDLPLRIAHIWADRCRSQISTGLAVLEADRGERPDTYWFGDRMSHADIAVAVVLRFLADAHPGLVSMAQFPALSAHAARLEALPVFQLISQPFIAPPAS